MLNKYVLRTPLVPFDHGKRKTNIFLKTENLQFLGSYKIRGVASAIESAKPEVLKKGLTAVSAGNMAQAVAFAAQILNVSCRIFVPTSAPLVKKTAIKNLGAELIELAFEEIWNLVKSGYHSDGLFIHPVFTTALLKGYGRISQEILEDLNQVDAIVIPFGIGGLTLGIVQRLKIIAPHVSIYTCEPSTAAPLHAALEAGRSVKVERHPSFIDAIGTPEVLPFVFTEVKDLVKESLIVQPQNAMLALQEVLRKNKLLCEGAAGVCVAAATQLADRGIYKNIVCILSGGNISPEVVLKDIN